MNTIWRCCGVFMILAPYKYPDLLTSLRMTYLLISSTVCFLCSDTSEVIFREGFWLYADFMQICPHLLNLL